MTVVYLLGILTIIINLVTSKNLCQLRTTEYGLICVCNSTYCDTVPRLENLQIGDYQFYTTSKENLGFWSTTGKFLNIQKENYDEKISISDITKTHQTIIGFGGAFTDSTGINIGSLSNEAQENLMQTYFGEDGIQYSIGRIPIGSTDFSTRFYTYCDKKDATLKSFSLQKEDYNYKIPYIQRAKEIRGSSNLKYFASAWGAPTWMKSKKTYSSLAIDVNYFDIWAKYYLKFFDAYKESGIEFWGVTTQNEPINSYFFSFKQFNGFTFDEMRKWVKVLGPAIRNSSYSETKIILHDDQRLVLPLLKSLVLSDSEVVKYADGVGLHFYTDGFTPGSFLNLTESVEKPLFKIATEGCAGGGLPKLFGFEKPVELGSWKRADRYLDSIIEDLEYDVIGWVDWNMALNTKGGPNWIYNLVDSPIIVNATADEFYKQPMYYALGHFSKFVIPNSIRIDVETTSGPNSEIKSLAFLRPDGKISVILRNKSESPKIIEVNILGNIQQFTLEASSINTLVSVIA